MDTVSGKTSDGLTPAALLPLNVVLDYPRRYRVRRLRQSIRKVTGGSMVFLGVLATGAVVPLAWLVGSLYSGASIVVVTIAALVAIALVAIKVGLRLVQGTRELALFLRHFGYGDATQVVSFAVEKTIGASWRLVTLDDAAVVPVGLSTGTRRLAGAVRDSSDRFEGSFERLSKVLEPFFHSFLGLVILLTGTGIGVVYAGPGPYSDVVHALMRRQMPTIRLDLPGAFAILAILGVTVVILLAAILLLGAIGFLVLYTVTILCIPLFGVLSLATAFGDAARDAEQFKIGRVEDTRDVDEVADALSARSRKILAARIVVLGVASAVWQQTVIRLALVASVTIIDVSEPTENLLWEIGEVSDRPGSRCVFIGQSDLVAGIGSRTEATPPAERSLNERLLRLLNGREVVGYMTDRRAMRRFTRTLRVKLLELSA